MDDHDLSLRELYRTIEGPGAHPLKDAQAALDLAVASCYQLDQETDLLKGLLKLNRKLAAIEANGKVIVGPGLPAKFNVADFTSGDSLTVDGYK